MFTTAFTALLASSSILLAHAIVTPTEPGPGDSFNAGATCHIAWNGDSTSTTEWKTMNIELMSGSNWQMNHITTVAQNQDGTTSGTFDYPCPEVTPNAAIYFYQFSSPTSANLTWTTRFTIASASGETTDPENQTQPNGDAIPWGIGALTDPSTAVAAPATGAGASSGSSNSTSASGSGSASGVVGATSVSSQSTVGQTSVVAPSSSSSLTTSLRATGSSTPSRSSSATASAASASASNAASSLFGADVRVVIGGFAVAAAALL